MKAIVTGMIATYPLGGVAWDYGQYALGLEKLGWEVYYLEDTGGQTYDPTLGLYGDDPSYGVRFLSDALEALSPNLGSRWHFRSADGKTWGMEPKRIWELAEDADLFLNVSGSALIRTEYAGCRCKVLIDTDPGWNHFVNYPKWDAGQGWNHSGGFRAHDWFFTYAERMGKPGCPLPDFELNWHPTRPPVVLECWETAITGNRWTTVMTWDNFRRPIEYDGTVYGTKEMEFARVEQIPIVLPGTQMEVAVGGSTAPRDRWRALGWVVEDSHRISTTPDRYRDYIQSSRGEFSVEKNLYVGTRCGWFSCRSVCYLAAARPVVLQDTGFSEIIPTGAGVLAFRDMGQALDGIREVESRYEYHSAKAREVAAEYFDSRAVLGDILRRTGLA